MNKQRKVLITITYNEMGIIIDTKAEEIAQPNLQQNCNKLATDCISRQAAIDAISCDITVTGRQNAELVAATIGTFADRIKALPSAQPEWIPCSERLPEEEEDFLVTDGESMAVGYYRQDARAWDSTDFGWIENKEKGYGINEVVAWMPLPEPYKGE